MTNKKTPQVKNPSPDGDKRRKGKKNINWKDDPEIGFRLAKVSELMTQEKSALEIAQETKVSLGTAKRDITRIRELWKDLKVDRIANSRDIAIMQYVAQIKNAWEKAMGLPATNPNGPAWMNIALRAQQAIDKITGIGGDKVEHSGPNGGPIPLEVQDTKAIQEKRLKELAPMLAELLKQENDGTKSTDTDNKKSQ